MCGLAPTRAFVVFQLHHKGCNSIFIFGLKKGVCALQLTQIDLGNKKLIGSPSTVDLPKVDFVFLSLDRYDFSLSG